VTYEIQLPADDRVETRIAWAGEVFVDICEGLVTNDVGWYVWQMVVGWSDLCTAEERRQYLTMAGQISDLLDSRRE
jgi:hypothetical protein